MVKSVDAHTEDTRFLFSVIVPVYNAAAHLEECIQSILNQTLGFEDAIQLVLVNDGSTDSSALICESYATSFPGNIVYIATPNQGSSAARATGLRHAKGTYINFLDADDYWSANAFECAARFFERNPEVHITTARHTYFGPGAEGVHPLTFKYMVDSVVDIHHQFSLPLMSYSNAFIERTLLQEAMFNTSLEVGEDSFVVNEILLRMGTYGIMAQPTYWYRKEGVGSSMLSSTDSNTSWYFDTPQSCHERLMALSRECYGEVIPYIQYCVAYDLQWRFMRSAPVVLNAQEVQDYYQLLSGLLQHIDTQILFAQRHAPRFVLLSMVATKYGISYKEAQERLVVIGTGLYWEEPSTHVRYYVCRFQESSSLCVDSIQEEAGMLKLDGVFDTLLPHAALLVVAATTGVCHTCVLSEATELAIDNPFQRAFHIPQRFEVHVPFETLHFYVDHEGAVAEMSMEFSEACALCNDNSSFAHIGSSVLTSRAPFTELEVNKASQALLARRKLVRAVRDVRK